MVGRPAKRHRQPGPGGQVPRTLPVAPVPKRKTARIRLAETHQARIRFGSWDAALQAAGVDPGRVRLAHTKWTKAEVISALRARHAEGRSMRLVDMRADQPRLAKAAQKLFPCSLARALRAAGLEHALAGGRVRSARGEGTTTPTGGHRRRSAQAPG